MTSGPPRARDLDLALLSRAYTTGSPFESGNRVVKTARHREFSQQAALPEAWEKHNQETRTCTIQFKKEFHIQHFRQMPSMPKLCGHEAVVYLYARQSELNFM